jgi:DNA-binding PadR family transcriptional regulator
MEDRGWLRSRWVEKPGQRRRCHYRITEAGRKCLAAQRADWSRFIAPSAWWQESSRHDRLAARS